MSDNLSSKENLITLTADIVAAHVANNAVGIGEVSHLVTSVYETLAGLGQPPAPEVIPQVPAVSIRASVKPEYIVCLEDGKRLKMLKRHLSTRYNMTPDDYRAKWGLPANYPMVAANYAEMRRDLAKKLGLGRKAGESPKRKKLALKF